MGQNIADLSLPSQAEPLSVAREGSSCSSLGEAGDSRQGLALGRMVRRARAGALEWPQAAWLDRPSPLCTNACFGLLAGEGKAPALRWCQRRSTLSRGSSRGGGGVRLGEGLMH